MNVIPLPKKGNSYSARTTEPFAQNISLLSHQSKVMLKIIQTHLNSMGNELLTVK